MDQQTYSLLELNQYVKQVIALNFEVGIWIEAQISQVGRSRNHIYIDLIEKDADDIQVIAFSKATIWARTAIMLRKKYGDLFDDILQEGQSVKLLISVEFHERYGFSLNIQDLDPQFTLGEIILHREEIINQLKKEKLLEKNSALQLNQVLQRIAILSSESAAGYQDFFNTLKDNDYEYYFDLTLYTVALQGQQVQEDVMTTLLQLEKIQDQFDAVVIIRGGGAKVDLAAFDHVDIARSIANFPIPILTGIGHEIDICVADVVAHTHFKTPTAVSEYIIQHNKRFEEQLYNLSYRLNSQGMDYINREKLKLQRSSDLIHYRINQSLNTFDQIKESVFLSAQNTIQENKTSIDHSQRILTAIDPNNILARGYSITTLESTGELIQHLDQVKSGERLLTKLDRGILTSVTE